VNQYLAVAALIAGGLYGIENELELEPIFEGNAYGSDAPRVPTSLRDAAELFGSSTVALEAFGADVVNHYLNNARIEQRAFDSAITDWERVRGFERF
jgi:glutamine synthetase